MLSNRYGDCKDASQLLAVMLREAGARVELVTLGAADDGQVAESVPSPWGTHAILLATIDGREHWIDTTASLAGWDFLPRDDRDRLCYLVDDKGKLSLRRTPPLSASRSCTSALPSAAARVVPSGLKATAVAPRSTPLRVRRS